ncbi:glucan endo-1,3-beta-glucosidase 2-like [Dioscorea cayenensis subsp. rotundata]|uniref:Glucan endo-1,3-beta-glucosidase 2-like n=1 Tax=Dioscorea cayennensis subsp. rotundata TaxID=55577 RepID=A0AB40BYD0_DIOCR|nr:glucan endo-1,3-beta-glucosidase 2-like [Dioscorea cayenensis subsp. rotundata]
MEKKLAFIHGLLMVECCLVIIAMGARMQQKSEAGNPIQTLSPPEGNTTFVEGTTWCIALPGVSQADLQKALDWACGSGNTDCSPVRQGGPCFEPDNIVSHASYAFNNYYQQNGNSDIACNFGGTATIINRNPSYGSCVYPSSEQTSESLQLSSRSIWRIWGTLLMVLCLNVFALM